MNKPKILFFDIETAPNLAYVWGKYEQNVLEYESEWYIMSWCAKWLGQKKMITCKLPDYPRYKKNKEDDKDVVKELWKLFNEADIIIGHNGDKFDIRKTNARFLYHGLLPPTPYKTIDTLKVARKYFNFNSNKLDDLGRYLKIGRKVEHEGFGLWMKCMQGNIAAWNRMIKYNKQDVVLLEQVYEKFKPYITNHPNMGMYLERDFVCPNCGSNHLQSKGYKITKTRKYKRYQCQKCGAYCNGTHADKEVRANVAN